MSLIQWTAGIGATAAIVGALWAVGYKRFDRVVCPYWMGYMIDNPIRERLLRTRQLLQRFVEPGMKVADVGCGHGGNSVVMARMVRNSNGEGGRVYSIDIQESMLQRTRQRAIDSGVGDTVEVVKCTPNDPSIPRNVDFVLLSMMLHEVPDAAALLRSCFSALEPGGRLLLIEPIVHVDAMKFAVESTFAYEAGFRNATPVKSAFVFNAMSFQKPNN